MGTLQPTVWTTAYAVATTIEAMGQARPLWLIVGTLLAVMSVFPKP